MARFLLPIVLAVFALAYAVAAAPAKAACPMPRSAPARTDAGPAGLVSRNSSATVVRLWLRVASTRRGPTCGLTAPGYKPTTPSFGSYSSALLRTLRPQPGHRLYLVVLVSGNRMGRYVLDLVRTDDGRWLVDLWAEL